MACKIETVRKVESSRLLKICHTHGIAWVADGQASGAWSAHPNVGTRQGAKIYGKGARIVKCHGWYYNTSDKVGSDPLTQIAAEACRCGGKH